MPANELYVAWWNVENLFDTEKSRSRSAKLKRVLKGELEGWTAKVLKAKLAQLAEVIRFMNYGKGPDLLGVCEVENRKVLEKLVKAIGLKNRNYGIAHHDCEDGRGIDVAFIYDKKVFRAKEQFSHEVLKRFATRDIFQVNFELVESKHKKDVTPPRASPARGGKKELIVIGNHWPSRMGGKYESEPYRMLAAETLSYWMERIAEIKGKDAPVLVMGDFNDRPSDDSLEKYANSTRMSEEVMSARSVPRLFNLMFLLLAQQEGTYYHGSKSHILDQILVSRGLLGNGPLQVIADSTEVIRLPAMEQGKKKKPHRFGRPSRGNLDLAGYSDHFPVGVRVGV